jgi:hypothetical protein
MEAFGHTEMKMNSPGLAIVEDQIRKYFNHQMQKGVLRKKTAYITGCAQTRKHAAVEADNTRSGQHRMLTEHKTLRHYLVVLVNQAYLTSRDQDMKCILLCLASRCRKIELIRSMSANL